MVEITATEQNIQKWIKKKNEDSLRDLWENIKHTNICVRRAPKREVRRERIWENIWRNNSWKFPYYGKGNSQQSLGNTEGPRQTKPKEEHTRHMVIKMIKKKKKVKIKY